MSSKVFFLSLLLVVVACCASWGAALSFTASPQDFAGYTFSQARYDASSDGVVVDPSVAGKATGGVLRGVIESPVIESPFPFDTAYLSWNATTPKGSYVIAYLQARSNGVWGRWYKMAVWAKEPTLWKRTTFDGEKDSIAYANCSEMSCVKKADAIKIRMQLETADGQTYPTLRFVGLQFSDSPKCNEPGEPNKAAWGKDINVPILSQLSVPHGSVWCSATSTTMVLRYWGEQLNRRDLTTIGITQAANGIVDASFGGTGNWPFNTAFAGSHPGIRAYILRLANISQIEDWIAKGVPVIVSVDYNKLRHRAGGPMGHLMVIRGFTEDGKPIFNDPWGDPKDLSKLKKVFTREDLEGAWLGGAGSFGTVYIIYPENHKV